MKGNKNTPSPSPSPYYTASAMHVRLLKKPAKRSRKGDNGILLAIAGSKQYHGASIFVGLAASRIVDLVYFCTEKENIPFVKKASPEFIVSETKDYEKCIGKCDAVLIGPGISENALNRKTVNRILSHYRQKKTVLDAAALYLADKKLLHENCALTPHAGEFRKAFGKKATKENLKTVSKKFRAVIVLKGHVDLIAVNGKIYGNYTGNQGMTKGGTGDILAGLIAGFACKNDLLLSCLAACYLNGLAGDLLEKEKGYMYNAADLLEKIPEAKKACEKTRSGSF